MATTTITYPDGQGQRILNGLGEWYGVDATKADVEGALKAEMRERIRIVERRAVVASARNAALADFEENFVDTGIE